MGNVSEECKQRFNGYIAKSTDVVQDVALSGLYGNKPCCDNKIQDVMKAVFAKSLIDRYNDFDGSGTALILINQKQAECMCKWIERKFPLDVNYTV